MRRDKRRPPKADPREPPITASGSISTAADTVRFLQIEPTTRCNYVCGFCTGRQMDQSDLSFDTFQDTLDAFPSVEHVELQGEGEPFLHKNFFSMAQLCRDRGIRVSLITNGSLLTAEVVERILECRITAVGVSIESSEPAAFREIRGGKLEKVCQGIGCLLQERDRLGRHEPTVGFMITVLKDTVGALAGIAKLYDSLGMDGGFSIQPLN